MDSDLHSVYIGDPQVTVIMVPMDYAENLCAYGVPNEHTERVQKRIGRDQHVSMAIFLGNGGIGVKA